MYKTLIPNKIYSFIVQWQDPIFQKTLLYASKIISLHFFSLYIVVLKSGGCRLQRGAKFEEMM